MSAPPPTKDETGESPAETPEELGFTGCLAELDSIVRGLETDSIDVDRLSASVERAAELVEWCRTCLGDTRTRLDEVLPRLELARDGEEAEDESDGAGEGSDDEHG